MNCQVSMIIELHLFALSQKPIPKEYCPICLNSLTHAAPKGCCGTYARPLKKCGHFVHVTCQVDRNPNILQCPVCQILVADHKVYYECLNEKLLSVLPLHYRRNFIHNELTEEQLKILRENYRIDVEHLRKMIEYLYQMKDDKVKLEAIFKNSLANNSHDEYFF